VAGLAEGPAGGMGVDGDGPRTAGGVESDADYGHDVLHFPVLDPGPSRGTESILLRSKELVNCKITKSVTQSTVGKEKGPRRIRGPRSFRECAARKTRSRSYGGRGLRWCAPLPTGSQSAPEADRTSTERRTRAARQ